MSAPLRLALSGTLALLAAGEAGAASTSFGGTLDLRAGYSNDPYLNSNRSGGSGIVGGTLSAGVTSRTARSTTTLTGVADVSQTFSKYGRSENYSVGVSRVQQLTERLTVNGGVSYANTLNPGISYQNSFSAGAIYPTVGTTIAPTVGTTAGVGTTTASDPALIATSPVIGVPVGVFDASSLDLFTIGRRTQQISGNGGVSWTPTARDQISASGYVTRAIYKSFNGDYVSYGGSLTYLRTLNARTRVGLDGGTSVTTSKFYPDARSYTADLVLIRQINAIWNFNGRVGVIIPAGVYSRGQDATLGFSGTLCGSYPRSSVCFSASRQAAPTGIGGLRTDLQFTASLSYSLDQRTRVNAAATYDHSAAQAFVPRQNFYQVSVGASRDLNRRFAVGGSARYQKRSSNGGLAGGSGYAVTVDVITRFGSNAR